MSTRKYPIILSTTCTYSHGHRLDNLYYYITLRSKKPTPKTTLKSALWQSQERIICIIEVNESTTQATLETLKIYYIYVPCTEKVKTSCTI